MHYKNQFYKQDGVGLTGLLFWLFVLILVAMLGMKVIPVYIENASIKKNLVAMTNDSSLQNASMSQIRRAFSKRAQVDGITSVTAKDIKIVRDKGQLVLNTYYSVNVPLFANIALLINFDVQSE